MKNELTHFKKLCGIDTLYFFFESNENYDDLYLDIFDQVETQKAEQIRNELVADNNSIFVRISDINLQYLGKKEGFYWLRDENHMFRIGFKDKNKNLNLHNIRVQLEGNGIYTFGIKSIINLLENSLLKGFITGYAPVSRADLNSFIQYDLGFIDKTMFSTRKRKYSTINEIGTANETQTIYIGKPPFMLRIYNKSIEMKKSKKYDVMREYFLNNDFNLEETIFNVEFEMHRSYLRNYAIDDIKSLFANLENIFKSAMDEIRLIDNSSVSKEKLKNNKYKADTHPIWNQIKASYRIGNFLQNSMPIERIKRAVTIFNEQTYRAELISLFKKGLSRRFDFTVVDLTQLYVTTQKEMKLTREIKILFDDVKDFKGQRNEQIKNTKSGTIYKPVEIKSVKQMNKETLLDVLEVTREHMDESEQHYHTFKVAQREAIVRNLIPEVWNGRIIDDYPNS